MRFILPGDPLPLARCRFVSKDVVNKQREHKNHARRLIEHQFDQLDIKPLANIPLAMHIAFYMELPSQRKKREAYEKIHYHRWNPTLYDMVRMVIATMDGVVFASEGLISHVTSDKVFDEYPRTEITIKEIG